MLRGLYTAASGMYASQRKTEMLTNNMANAQTPGFKEDQSAVRTFPEMLLQRFESQSGPHHYGNSVREPVGSLSTGVYLQELLPRFTQGALRKTERPTDLALSDRMEGTTFFTVQQNEETKYTRNGRFTVDPSGLLTTENGLPVLSENGDTIQLANDEFHVNERGVITVEGEEIARLGVAIIENPESLLKEGDGLYRTEDGVALPLAYDLSYGVKQGYIEGSTVDLSRSMTDMLATYRTFEANQKIIQAYDRSLEKAANEIGRVNG